MTNATLTSNSKVYDDGELWSFIRRCMSQGKDIHLDHAQRTYEEYSARLDLAALERLPELKAYIVRAVVAARGSNETFEQPMLTVRSRGPLGPNDVIVDATELVKHVTFRMSLKIPADANAQKAATEKREPLFGESIEAELQRVYGLVNHWYEETQRLTRERDEARRDCLNFKMHGNIAGTPEGGSQKAGEQS